MNKKYMTTSSTAIAPVIALAGCSAGSGASMPGAMIVLRNTCPSLHR